MKAARVLLGIAMVKSSKDGQNVKKPNWWIMVDERIQLKFSDFFETKNGMIEPACEQSQQWKDAGKEGCYICIDTAGENKHHMQQPYESVNWKFKI
jgi:hypothetical protein